MIPMTREEKALAMGWTFTILMLAGSVIVAVFADAFRRMKK
jgi:hypothetical protein